MEGDEITIISGPLTSLQGRYKELTGGRKARVLLDFLGEKSY